VVASDGLWDVYTSAEAVSAIRKGYRSQQSAQEIADDLVSRALTRRTQDNVVCVIVFLNEFSDEAYETIQSKKSGMFGMF